MTTKTIQIPAALSETFSFRWFVEYAIDHSPKFQTASAIAKASLLLAADLDTPGPRDVDAKALDLLREAIAAEDPPLVLPPLIASTPGPDGEPTERTPVTPRVFVGYVYAILHDAPPAALATAAE